MGFGQSRFQKRNHRLCMDQNTRCALEQEVGHNLTETQHGPTTYFKIKHLYFLMQCFGIQMKLINGRTLGQVNQKH
jgi:hypothetical protein